MPPPRRRNTREKYSRTNQPHGDLLVQDNPDLNDEPAIWYIGTDDFRQLFSPSQAGTLSAVTRATSLIVNTLAASKWRTLKAGSEQFPRSSLTEMPSPRWLSDPMLARPDDRFPASPAAAAKTLSRPAFWGEWIRSALLRGQGYLLFEDSDFDGRPVAGSMKIINPDYVTPLWNSAEGYVHRRIGSYQSGEYVETDRDGYITLDNTRFRLIELRNPLSPVDDLGMAQGVLEMHARELGLAAQATEYAAGMFQSGVPAGYLKVNKPIVSEAQASALQTKWMNRHGSARRKIAVLNSWTDFHAVQLSAQDQQLIQSRQFSLNDIANAFGVPGYFLGASEGGSLTYATVESRSLDFRAYTLLSWCSAVEEVLSSLMPTGQYVEIDLRTLLRADLKTRYESYHMALEDKWLTVDEVRQLEGLGPMNEVAL